MTWSATNPASRNLRWPEFAPVACFLLCGCAEGGSDEQSTSSIQTENRESQGENALLNRATGDETTEGAERSSVALGASTPTFMTKPLLHVVKELPDGTAETVLTYQAQYVDGRTLSLRVPFAGVASTFAISGNQPGGYGLVLTAARDTSPLVSVGGEFTIRPNGERMIVDITGLAMSRETGSSPPELVGLGKITGELERSCYRLVSQLDSPLRNGRGEAPVEHERDDQWSSPVCSQIRRDLGE